MEEELIKERTRKKERYEKVASPYPARVARDATIEGVLTRFTALARGKRDHALVGRVTARRDQGKIMFVNLTDESGTLQLVLEEATTKPFALIKETLDLGDFAEAKGVFMTTKRGTKSMGVKEFRIIAKSMRPLPVHWYGLEDVETRLRKRYLDLLVHPETKKLFIKKARFWDAVRATLAGEGFLPVETGVLEAVPGGAEAEPFVTHHHALNTDFYLRISLELPLKRLLVGGFEKVYEIGRVFRNEGIDREHLQDYTSMECYAAYWDDEAMMKFVEKMYKGIVKATTGGLMTKFGDKTLRWGGKWKRVDYFDAFKSATGLDLAKATDGELRAKAQQLALAPESTVLRGRLIDLIYKKTVRPKLIEPSFLVGHPKEVSPLAKEDPKRPGRALRFQPMAAGSEMGNGWAELNDPKEQRARFEEQERARAAGDKEAQRLDEDFIEALEYGMPPA
ncbi:MAG: lysine--tRNA ligase, partial [Candidatus Jorgensenbacteria bacterium]|nr:lysine--tRNA ligase [Candidatus Jorgensenbacteria bacterium]